MTDAQLISSIIAAYSLTKDDISSLATQITQSRLNTTQASYRRAQRTTGLAPNYTVRNTLQRRIERQSAKDAQSIAETYQDLLRTFLETMLEARSLSKTWNDVFSNVRDAVTAIVAGIGVWLSDFLPWKSKQVANFTCGSGLNDGIDQFIEDNYSNVIDTESGEVVNWKDYAIQVLPDTSSSDECSSVAGKLFDLSENDEIIPLPAHANCPHYKQIIQI